VLDKAAASPVSLPQPDIITEAAAPLVAEKPAAKKPDQPAVGKVPQAAKPIVKEQATLAKTAEPNAPASKSPAADAGRFVVQVGAFADATRAQEVRLKVERAGLKTYTHVAETKDGRRTRVRVGPFSTRAEAQKAAEKIKKLNLPAALLTL
jgi:DedD protein